MKSVFRILSIIPIIILLLSFDNNIQAQTPDSALWESSSKYIFSSAAFPQKTGEFTVTVFDEDGNPVPENTPVAFSINYGKAEGTTLFKTEESGNITGGGVFYFKTDAQGKIKVDYIPDYTPRGFRSFQDQYPDSSLNFIWGKHDEQNKLTYYSWSSLLVAVNIPNPNDEQSAQLVANIPLKKSSVTPVLLGPSYSVVTTKSKNNDEYIFTTSGVNPEKAELTISVFDGLENPVPAGTPFGVRLNHPGKIPSEQVIQEPEEGSFRDYVLVAGENGQLVIDYFAPLMVPPPFTDWFNRIFKDLNYSMDTAWDLYKQPWWDADEGFDDIGYAAIKSISGIDKNFFNPENLIFNSNTLDIDILQSTPPVLVGPDKIFFGAISKENDEYVFASALHAESAEVFISVEDSRGRAVPSGAPIMINLQSIGLVGITGKVIGKGVFRTENSGGDTRVYFRVGENGETQMTYVAPYVNVVPKRLFNNHSFTYDELYSGIELTANAAAFDCGICQFPDQLFWNTPAESMLTPDELSKVPVVIGPDYAEVTVKPDTIKAGKIVANIKGKVFDARGIPVPSNTNVVIIPSKGNVPDAPLALRLTTGENGEVFGTYKSDTRPIGQSASPVTVSMYTPDNAGNPEGWLLGSDVFHTKGGAVNKATHKYGQYLLGLSITETIQGLNPLKAYSSMKRFKERVDNVGNKYRKLIDNIGTGNLSASDYDAYQQAWGDVQSSFHKLVQDIPGTSITGPGNTINAGGLVKELSINGTKRALLNTARGKILSKALKKSMAYSVDVFAQQQFFGNQKRRKAPFISEPEPFFQNIDVALTSDFHTLSSESGTFEVYGAEFKIPASDSLISLGVLEAGTQAPIFENILPQDVSLFGLEQQGLISPGVIEITEIDAANNTIKAVLLLFVSTPVSDDFELIIDQELGIDRDTLAWFNETQLIFQDSTVLETDNYFFGSAMVPNPFIQDQSIYIDRSYVVGSFASDSSIQNITFNKPAFIEIVDSALAVNHTAYHYDEETSSWNSIPGLSKNGDTLFIPVDKTSIVGLGQSSSTINEPPFLASLRDTTLEKGATLVSALMVSDKEDDPLTITAESDTSAAQISVDGNTLTTVLDSGFTGIATITVNAFDGANTSSTSFKITVNSVNQAPFITALSDTSVFSGEVLTRAIIASDPDGDNLTYSAETDTSAIQASFEGNVLTVIPDNLFIGESVITISVMDQEVTASDSFILTVNMGTDIENQTDFPTAVELQQNYPNPFNPSTTIAYGLPKSGKVTLEIFDILGRKVAALLNNEYKPAGRHTIQFNASHLASGLYIYRLRTGKDVIVRKLTLIK